MKQRLLIILLTLLTTMTAWAQNSSGTFSSGVTWNFDTGTKTLTFTGSGVIPDKPNSGQVPWNNTLVEHLVFDSGITRIGKNVFKNHVNLKDVVFQAGCQLTEIGYMAFNSCTSLSAITLPEHLTSIGNNAFEYCLSLASVSIPASVTTIGERTFRGCSVLKSVNISVSVTSIGREAFWECTGLEACTILSTKLTSISGGCFNSCSSLTAIEIPEGVTSIGISAFLGCTSLKCVTLPKSLQSIDLSAFKNCSSLEAVYCKVVDPTNLTIDNEAFNNNTAFYLSPDADIEAWTSAQFTNITYNTFSPITVESGETNVTLDFSGTLTVTKRTGNGVMGDGFPSTFKEYLIIKVVIEPGVTTIGNFAFNGCTGLTSVTIPGSVETIGNYAFNGCTGLTSVTIPEGVTTIGSSAFFGCTGLTSVTISGSVTTIGSSAFNACTGLTSVTIHEGVTTIGESAFKDCTGLTSVTIPEGVTTIGNFAFRDCTGLTSVTIPEGVTTIGNSAFDACTGLTSVTISGSVETIGESAFKGCTGLTSVTISGSVETIGESAFNGCTGLTSVTFHEGVTTIGNFAFKGCTGLTSVTIPEGVTTIGNSAFNACTGLASVTIPEGVTTIGNEAFRDCTGLTSVTIPSSVETIGDGAFRDCTGLTSVTIFAPSLTKYEYRAFDNNAVGRKIYVPSGSVGTYKAGWNGYVSASDIEPLDYIIDEGKDVSILSNGTGKNVALKRSFAKGKKQTVCLPYAPKELLNYGKVWEFTGINEDKAVMTEITNKASLQANTPYIFEASNDLLNITFPGVDISIGSDPKTAPSGAGFTFHGTYAEKIWEATSNEVTGGTIYGFMMKDNDGQTAGQFVKARRRTVLRPFSCYLEYSGDILTGTASATRGEAQEPLPDAIDIVWLTAGDAGSATGIKEVKSEKSGVEGWFSLDGRRLSGKPTAKGIYIHEGKKVVVK